jgi:hypothetical protein
MEKVEEFMKYQKGNILCKCNQNFSSCYMKTDGQKVIEGTKGHIFVAFFRKLTQTHAVHI